MQTLLVVLLAVGTLSSCGKDSSSSKRSVKVVRPVALTLSQTLVQLPLYGSAQLEATMSYDDGSKKDVTESVSWSSSNLDVADAVHGQVSAHRSGEARIRATLEGHESELEVRVAPAKISHLTIVDPGFRVPLGEEIQLKAEVIYEDGTRSDATPTAEWSVKGESVQLVSNKELARGHIRSIAVGASIVEAVLAGHSSQVIVEATAARPQALLLNSLPNELPLGLPFTLRAHVLFGDGTRRELAPQEMKWELASFDGARAVINPHTQEFAVLSTGEVHLTLRALGLSVTKVIVAAAPLIKGLEIVGVQSDLLVGSQHQLKLLAGLSDGSTVECQEVVWTSSDESVVHVNGAGVLEVLRAGSVVLTGRYHDQLMSMVLSLRTPQLKDLTIFLPPTVLNAGEERDLSAWATTELNQKVDVTSLVKWSSSDAARASIDAQGKLVAHAAGAVEISGELDGLTHRLSLTIITAPVEGLGLVAAGGLPAQSQLPFALQAQRADGSVSDFTVPLTWTSSSPLVAYVELSVDGQLRLVTGLPGVATLSTSYQGKVFALTLTVRALQLLGIEVVEGTLQQVGPGFDLCYRALGLYENGQRVDLTQEAHWFSSAASVVQVSNARASKGCVRFKRPGVASIYPVYQGRTGERVMLTSDR